MSRSASTVAGRIRQTRAGRTIPAAGLTDSDELWKWQAGHSLRPGPGFLPSVWKKSMLRVTEANATRNTMTSRRPNVFDISLLPI